MADELPGRSKRIQDTRLIPVLLDLVTPQDIDATAKARSAQSVFLAEMAKLKSKDSSYKIIVDDQSKMQSDLMNAFSPAQRMSDLLTTISNESPPNVWLTGITLERGKQVSRTDAIAHVHVDLFHISGYLRHDIYFLKRLELGGEGHAVGKISDSRLGNSHGR